MNHTWRIDLVCIVRAVLHDRKRLVLFECTYKDTCAWSKKRDLPSLDFSIFQNTAPPTADQSSSTWATVRASWWCSNHSDSIIACTHSVRCARERKYQKIIISQTWYLTWWAQSLAQRTLIASFWSWHLGAAGRHWIGGGKGGQY